MAKVNSERSHDRGYVAFRVLQVAFVVAPLLAGLDKFIDILADWTVYIAPVFSRILRGHDQGFMMIVGVIEIIAGLGVIFKPRIFAFIVSLWLLLIVINLLIAGYYDIALRDLGLCLSAFALGKLAQKYTNGNRV